MSNAALCATSTVSSQKRWKSGQHLAQRRLGNEQLGIDAVDAARFPFERTLGIDELLEHFVLEQAPVDDAHGAQADDLVARRRLEAGSLGIEHRVGELAERLVVEFTLGPDASEEIEVIDIPVGFPRAGVAWSGCGAASPSGSRNLSQDSPEASSRSCQISPPWRSSTSLSVSGVCFDPTCIGCASHSERTSLDTGAPVQTRSSSAKPCLARARSLTESTASSSRRRRAR